MKLKNNIYKTGIMALMGFTLSACSDFLEVENLNEIVIDKFWQEESDVNNIVTGCYSELQRQAVVDRMMAWGEWRSDNIIGGTNVTDDASLSNIFKENINASNIYCTWGEFYKVINDCNTVLLYAPKVAERDPNYTQSKLDATRAEVSALRDLCYFYLIRAFRDVPYSTEAIIDDQQKIDIPATKFNDVLDSLINDLEQVKGYAVKYYPDTKPLYQTGRITLDAINAMLCDMYLWKQDYNNAVRCADLVIDAKTIEYTKTLREAGVSDYSAYLIDGYPLIDDAGGSTNTYGTAFTNIFGVGNSRESILELTYTNDNAMLSNAAVSFRYGNQETNPGFVKAANFIGTDVKDGLFKVFLNSNDSRSYENFISMGTSNVAIAKYAYPIMNVMSQNGSYLISTSGLYPKEHCAANWILYRLSDVMLMKAEALVELVNSDDTTQVGKAVNDSLLHQAYDIVTAVNKRSYIGATYTQIPYGNYSSKSLMANLVQDERNRELMFEGKRWFDLVRRSMRDGNTNYLVDKVKQKYVNNSSTVQSFLKRMDAIFWPYHKDEVKVNPNLQQNPAFGSGENNSYESTK